MKTDDEEEEEEEAGTCRRAGVVKRRNHSSRSSSASRGWQKPVGTRSRVLSPMRLAASELALDRTCERTAGTARTPRVNAEEARGRKGNDAGRQGNEGWRCLHRRVCDHAEVLARRGTYRRPARPPHNPALRPGERRPQWAGLGRAGSPFIRPLPSHSLLRSVFIRVARCDDLMSSELRQGLAGPVVREAGLEVCRPG